MAADKDLVQAAPDARLRILMVAARAAPFVGGIETHIAETSERLVARGHQVVVATTDPTGKLPSQDMHRGVPIRRVPAWPRDRDYHWAPGLLRTVAEGDWDVIHIQGYHTFSAPLGMIAALRAKTPFVITFHSGGHSSAVRNSVRGLQHALLAPLVRRAARAIGVSQFEADHFSRRMGLRREDFVVVPNGAQMPTARPEAAPDPERPLILSVGRLERYKGHHRVAAGFAELTKRLPGARLRIVGDGPYRDELQRTCARLGIADRVEIGGLPVAERGAMATLMAQASLVALLSDYEAHPVAVMEALSTGARVLTTDATGFAELARDGLVRAVPLDADAVQIAAAMEDEIGALRERRALDLPDWEACADRLQAVYRSVARPRPASSRAGKSLGRAAVAGHT